jgi:carbonic anhydrase
MKMHKTFRGLVSRTLLAGLTVGLLATASAQAQLAQSPIDIRAEDVAVVNHLPSLDFTYSKHTALTVINTGSPDEEATVRAVVPAGAGKLTVDGVTYNLLQFHWHTPSEHLIEGEGTPLEMHLVHQAADGSLLVVAVFIVQGERHPELDKIFAHLPGTAGQSTAVADFNLRELLPDERESFRYQGSLTTPPFTEGVQFVVLEQAVELSRRQIEAFLQLFPEGNSREVQPLNGRTVRTDTDIYDQD